MYQTDFSGALRKEGCLFMSLLNIAEEAGRKLFNRRDILSLYEMLNAKGVLGTEKSRKQTGAFVYDHIAVLNEASRVLRHTVNWDYIGRKYEVWEEERGRKSFGSHKGASHIILQIQTPNTGHFRRLDYDPWRGGTTMLYLKSTRYYRMEEV